jgi:hypothetical protein
MTIFQQNHPKKPEKQECADATWGAFPILNGYNHIKPKLKGLYPNLR